MTIVTGVVATANPATKQLSDANTVGTIIVPSVDSAGNPPNLAVFGNVTPGPQLTGPQNAAVTRGTAGGSVATFATNTVSPAAVATLTSAEVTITPHTGTGAVWTVTTTDVVVINKPTAQAGIGIGNVRYNGAGTIGVTFNNITAGTLTPTAAQSYGVVALRNIGNYQTVTLTPASVATKTTAEQLFTVTGLRAGEVVIVNKPTSQAGLDVVGARVVTTTTAGVVTNQLGITFANFTAGTLTPTAGEAYAVISTGGIDVSSNLVAAQLPVIGGTIAPNVSGEITITSGNIVAQDQVIGISKPTLLSSLVLGSGRVASATTVAATFGNLTATTATPTAAEVLTFGLHRQNPAAPLVLYSTTITPTSVAATTTAEQTFTVTGLVAASPVWVNKPTATPGIGIVGARVSAAGVVAITFLNVTATAIVPPSETYVFGNFQMPIDTTAGNSWVQPVSNAVTSHGVLGNALRANEVSVGLNFGA